jgi:hypothetical protein
MKTKFIFSTEKKEMEQWADLPFIPRVNEWINIADILKKEEVVAIFQTAICWSTNRGTVQSVEYRYNNDFYVEVYVWCED